jgi:hypothetical protein
MEFFAIQLSVGPATDERQHNACLLHRPARLLAKPDLFYNDAL